MGVEIRHGDMRERLRELPDNSVDSVVCDPPYHLVSIVKRFGSPTAAPVKVNEFFDGNGNSKGSSPYSRTSKGFMGQTWDGGDVAFDPETWAEVFRVLKPGGHLAAFGGTRTYHRLACAIEDAGFEIRDQLAWVYGSGFPKSLDVSKAIDKAAGAEREIVGPKMRPDGKTALSARSGDETRGEGWDRPWRNDPSAIAANGMETAPATEAAQQWQGWGTALKPSWEPICLARKPLIGSVAANVLEHGTGALNIDGCRIEHGDGVKLDAIQRQQSQPVSGFNMAASKHGVEVPMYKPGGRWPANLCHDGSDEVLAGFPSGAGAAAPVRGTEGNSATKDVWGERGRVPGAFHGDSGSAARFFYCAKASKLDRMGSDHPTVKPVELMRWLVRMVTPPGGLVLDPFAGSGSTGIAALCEGFDALLVELREEAAADAQRRLDFIRGLGRVKALETARLDDDKRKKAGGDDLPLFAQ